MNKMFGFIGAGNMGGALAAAVAKAISPNQVLLYDKDETKATAVAKQNRALPAESLAALTAAADVLFIGVKPDIFPALFKELTPLLKQKEKKPLLISMAAGIPIAKIEELAEGVAPVIRIMPNTPVKVGEGMIEYTAGQSVSEEDKNLFRIAMAKAGVLDELPEEKIDAACALAGSGPAFVAVMAEALADAGVKAGLPRDKALLYTAQMMRGTATLLLDGMHPAALKDGVSSPGGTTIAGVEALERGGLRFAAMAAVEAAYRRAIEMKNGK